MRAILSDGSKAESSPQGGPKIPSQEESESRGLLRLLQEEGFRIAGRSYVAGAVMSTGDGAAMYVLTSGIASLSRARSAGKEATLGLLREWDVFGALEFAEDSIRRVQVRAVTPCEVAKLPRPLLEAAVGQNPSIALKLITLQDAQLTRYEEFVARISSRSIGARLAAVLLFLSENFPESPSGVRPDVAQPVTIGLRLTQEELAAMIVTTRESVVITMGELRRRGAIEVCSGMITVVDPEKLRELSGTQMSRMSRPARM
jgi:CRP/FNR family transcriptional regulator, global nitrogen regulator